MMKKIKIFPKFALAVFITYMMVLLIATVVAYNRRSGVTGLDMSRVQKLHYEANNHPLTP